MLPPTDPGRIVLACPRSWFRRLLDDLREQGPVLITGLGVRDGDPSEWLIRPPFAPDETSHQEGPSLRATLSPVWPPPPALPLALAAKVELWIGSGPQEGRAAAFLNEGGRTLPVDALRLPGPGMHVMPLSSCALLAGVEPPTDLEQWSRTIGALGGTAVWRRLARLAAAVVGCGRTGTLVAATLARLGLHRLILVDGDVVGPHVSEMDLIGREDVGRAKADALASHLARLAPTTAITPVAVSVDGEEGLESIRATDVIFCCVDNDAARFTCGLLASLYAKVLVDIGTGVFLDTCANARGNHDPAPRRAGADVRLITPGEGCVLCAGGLHGYEEAVHRILDRLPQAPRPWQQQRAGSLRTLNGLAANVAVQALLDLVAERLQGSVWARLELDQGGRLAVSYPALRNDQPQCPLCARTAFGDRSALGLWRGVPSPEGPVAPGPRVETTRPVTPDNGTGGRGVDHDPRTSKEETK